MNNYDNLLIIIITTKKLKTKTKFSHFFQKKLQVE